jgi:FtsX-like permease family protein
MTRTLRGIWSRRGTLLPLLLLTVVVVSGAVSVIGFADRAGTSPRLAVPLLLLGAVAVPATGRELANARRDEIAVARLRGLQGGALYRLLAVEPLLVLLLGGALGVVLGGAGAWLAGVVWVDASAALPGLDAVEAGVAIVVVGLVAVLAGMAGALREPLSEQVSVAARPRAASTGAIFGNVLVLVAAVVAVYRSSVLTSDEPDWVVLAGPALVGLAVGQVVVWLLRLGARLAVGRTARGALPGFLAARRLARVADAATPVRILVAASVVAALAVTGAAEVGDWTDDTARLRVGAPLQVQVDRDAVGAVALTRQLDPDGRWLMAAVLVPGEGSVAARRAFLDTERYDAVVGDFLDGTAAAGLGDRVSRLGGGDSSIATGDTVRATVRGVSSRRSGEMRPRVGVRYLDAAGTERRSTLSLRVPLSGDPATGEAPLRGCAGGCVVSSLTLARTPGDTTLPWILTTLDFGGADGLARSWKPSVTDRFGRPSAPVVVDDGLLAPASPGPLVAEPVSGGPRTPVLATDSATFDGAPLLDSTGGDERPADVVGRFPALPLVEADGLLADLPRAAAGAPPTVPAAQVMVLARADTPDDVLTRLGRAAGHHPRTLDQVRAVTSAEAGAAQARVYSLMAGFCLLAALLVLAAAVARQRSAWLREVAALRVVGVATGQLRGSGRMEVAWLAIAAVLATVAGAVGAVHLLLAHLSLVAVPEHAVPLRAGLDWWPIALATALAAAGVLLVTGRGRAVSADRGRPAILREAGAP